MMPIYEYLLDPSNDFGLDILMYSGDDDDVCATEGSQQWIYDLGFDTARDVRTSFSCVCSSRSTRNYGSS